MQIFASEFDDHSNSIMSETDVSKIISTYQDLFVHRTDVYARQTKTGSYFAQKAPVTRELVLRHLKGDLTVGFYAMAADNSVRWLALDGDRVDSLEQLQEAWKRLDQLQVPSYLEGSRRGAHLWLFFQPLPASQARRFLLNLLPNLEGVEVFLKRDELDQAVRYGNLMRAPLGVHQKSGQRYPFLDPVSLNPVSSTLFGMLNYLQQVERIDSHQLERLASETDMAPPPKSLPAAPVGKKARLSPIDRLKQQIGAPYSFINQFVALDRSGRGHCPFHPPDYHPSFVVHRQAGYWVDFHEVNPKTGRYAGGDAIEFYRKLRGLSYKEAIHELNVRLKIDV